MRRISEVLRLAVQGMSRRQISQSLRIGHSTVHDYRGQAEQVWLSWPCGRGHGRSRTGWRCTGS
jgi:transposase